MTNSEAQHLADAITEEIGLLLRMLACSDKKVLLALSKNLEEVRASYFGLIEPDQPLGVAWGLYDTKLAELLRTQILPDKLGQPAKTDEQIKQEYDDPGRIS